MIPEDVTEKMTSLSNGRPFASDPSTRLAIESDIAWAMLRSRRRFDSGGIAEGNWSTAKSSLPFLTMLRLSGADCLDDRRVSVLPSGESKREECRIESGSCARSRTAAKLSEGALAPRVGSDDGVKN